MSQTQRCVVCSELRIDRPLWEDEVCECCGRCAEHCTANESDTPHVLSFDPFARSDEGRPHVDAGRRVEKTFGNQREDPDRARTSVQPGADR